VDHLFLVLSYIDFGVCLVERVVVMILTPDQLETRGSPTPDQVGGRGLKIHVLILAIY